MGNKLEDYLLNEYNGAYLMEGEKNEPKPKKDYVKNAKTGMIIAFRIYFESKTKVKLTKVISGKIVKNDHEKEEYIVETLNGLKYGVPYEAVVWVKTGPRWPKGLFKEMKQGSVEIDETATSEFGGLSQNAKTIL